MPYTKPKSKPTRPIVLKMHNWYKNIFFDMATVPFQLPYMQIWTDSSNSIYTGLEPEFLASETRLRTLWATEQTCCLWKPIDMKLDTCDANSSKASVYKSPSFLILFWSRNMIFFK